MSWTQRFFIKKTCKITNGFMFCFQGGPQFAGAIKIFPGPGGPPATGPPVPPVAGAARLIEDEEVWRERRRQQSEDVALAVERAKQRKEEEEKRFKETRDVSYYIILYFCDI
jgi:hypothetical protein